MTARHARSQADEGFPPLDVETAEDLMAQKLRTCRILGPAVSIVITTLSETGSNLQHIFCNLPNEDKCLERALAAEDELAWGVMQDILEACTGVGAGLVNLAAVLSANFQRPLEDLERDVLMDADEKKDALLHYRRKQESCAARLTESLKKKERATSKLNSMQAGDASRPWFGKMQTMPHLSIPTMESFMDSPTHALQKAMAKQSEAVRVFNACKEETEDRTMQAQASLEEYCAMATYTQCTLQQILCSSLTMMARALHGVSSGGVQALQARARHVRPPTPVTDAPKPEWATCAAGRPPHRPSKAAQGPPPPPAETGNPLDPKPESSRRSKLAADKKDCGNASPAAMSDLSEDSADFSVGDTVVVDGRQGVIVWDGRAEGVSLIKVHWAGSEDSTILHRDEITGIVPSSADHEAADKQSEARATVKRAAEDVEACCKKAADARSSAATKSAAVRGVAARGGTSRSKAGATRRDEPKDRDTGKPGGEFANGEIAEVVILDGTDAGLWLKCRIMGRGGEAGTYNVQILPCADTNIERRYQINIKPVHLRKCAGGSSHYPTLLGQTPIESPQAPKKVSAAEKEECRPLAFREGELAEVVVLDGEHAGTWLRCRVAGPGGRAASFNISVLPTATWQSSQIDDVEVAHLRKIQAPDLAEITPSTCGGSEEYHLEPAASPKGDQTGVDNPCGAEVDDAPL